MKASIKILFKANPAMLAPTRALMRSYLNVLGLSQEQAQEITLAVDEACANAIRHAYANAPEGEVTMLLRSNTSLLEVMVADKGKPMPAANKMAKLKRPAANATHHGGRGLPLIRRVFDDVHITSGEKRGNRIRMRLHLK